MASNECKFITAPNNGVNIYRITTTGRWGSPRGDRGNTVAPLTLCPLCHSIQQKYLALFGTMRNTSNCRSVVLCVDHYNGHQFIISPFAPVEDKTIELLFGGT